MNGRIIGISGPTVSVDLRGLRLYERICQKSPHAEMHILNRGGHYSFREHPTAFNRVVRGFCIES